jgi:hypothetical protein
LTFLSVSVILNFYPILEHGGRGSQMALILPTRSPEMDSILTSCPGPLAPAHGVGSRLGGNRRGSWTGRAGHQNI